MTYKSDSKPSNYSGGLSRSSYSEMNPTLYSPNSARYSATASTRYSPSNITSRGYSGLEKTVRSYSPQSSTSSMYSTPTTKKSGEGYTAMKQMNNPYSAQKSSPATTYASKTQPTQNNYATKNQQSTNYSPATNLEQSVKTYTQTNPAVNFKVDYAQPTSKAIALQNKSDVQPKTNDLQPNTNLNFALIQLNYQTTNISHIVQGIPRENLEPCISVLIEGHFKHNQNSFDLFRANYHSISGSLESNVYILSIKYSETNIEVNYVALKPEKDLLKDGMSAKDLLTFSKVAEAYNKCTGCKIKTVPAGVSLCDDCNSYTNKYNKDYALPNITKAGGIKNVKEKITI